MGRGVFSGIVAGTAVSVLGVGALSLMTPLPKPQTASPAAVAPEASPAAAETPALEEATAPDPAPAMPEPAPSEVTALDAPAAEGVEVPAGSEFNKPKPEGEAKLPTTDDGPATAEAPAAPPVAVAEAPALDTTPAEEPQAVAEPGAMAPPAAEEGALDVTVAVEEPVLPSPAAPSPHAPAAEVAPEAADAPAPAPSDRVQPADDTPPEAVATAPGAIRVPVPGHEIALPDVTTGRLPSIGAEPASEAAAEPADLGALARYAVPFEAEPGKPLFSVILMDVGETGLDRETLTTFSFPVTFAVDAARPDAAQAMADYRAAGFEVILVAGGMPAGAQPQDLEVALQSQLQTMPETVAVMDPETGGFQSNRALVMQATAILGESGHGLVTFDRGLNTARQVAQSEGLPVTTIFRTLDRDRESVPTIRRYLDRAAFKAAQDGQVVMLGHSYAETVTALFSWALEGKGAEVNLAPASAILRAPAQ